MKKQCSKMSDFGNFRNCKPKKQKLAMQDSLFQQVQEDCIEETDGVKKYLHFKLYNALSTKIIMNNSRFISDIIAIRRMMIIHAFRVVKDMKPSALDVIVANLFPTHIHCLQSEENLRHYLTRRGGRLRK